VDDVGLCCWAAPSTFIALVFHNAMQDSQPQTFRCRTLRPFAPNERYVSKWFRCFSWMCIVDRSFFRPNNESREKSAKVWPEIHFHIVVVVAQNGAWRFSTRLSVSLLLFILLVKQRGLKFVHQKYFFVFSQ
jgi:hypothetical protein